MAMTVQSNARRSARVCGRRGLSLIEAVISTVVVGWLLVAAVNTLAYGARTRQVQAESGVGTTLAQQLMSEILQASYQESESLVQGIDRPGSGGLTEITMEPVLPVFGPESGEVDGTRTYFDDVDDYDGWSASPPQAKDGTELANCDGWTREVTVTYGDPATLNQVGKLTDSGLKYITVTVTDQKGQQTTSVALRSGLGTYDQSPTVETMYLSWVGLGLQIGSDASSLVESSANLLNQPVLAAGE